MKCKVCGKTPAMGITLFRQNAKGQPGIWACEEHSKPIENDLAMIVATIQQQLRGKGRNND